MVLVSFFLLARERKFPKARALKDKSWLVTLSRNLAPSAVPTECSKKINRSHTGTQRNHTAVVFIRIALNLFTGHTQTSQVGFYSILVHWSARAVSQGVPDRSASMGHQPAWSGHSVTVFSPWFWSSSSADIILERNGFSIFCTGLFSLDSLAGVYGGFTCVSLKQQELLNRSASTGSRRA